MDDNVTIHKHCDDCMKIIHDQARVTCSVCRYTLHWRLFVNGRPAYVEDLRGEQVRSFIKLLDTHPVKDTCTDNQLERILDICFSLISGESCSTL